MSDGSVLVLCLGYILFLLLGMRTGRAIERDKRKAPMNDLYRVGGTYLVRKKCTKSLCEVIVLDVREGQFLKLRGPLFLNEWVDSMDIDLISCLDLPSEPVEPVDDKPIKEGGYR